MNNNLKRYSKDLVLLGVLLVLITYCYQKCRHFEEVPSVRSPLINNFKSYMSIEEARQMLPSHLKNWKVIGDYPFSTIERFPTFRLYLVWIEKYQHLNHTGNLVLIFYNNRLAITSFFPLNINLYVKALEEKEVIKIVVSDSISYDKPNMKPYTYVWLFVPPPNYVDELEVKESPDDIEWADIRLVREMTRWRNCYDDD